MGALNAAAPPDIPPAIAWPAIRWIRTTRPFAGEGQSRFGRHHAQRRIPAVGAQSAVEGGDDATGEADPAGHADGQDRRRRQQGDHDQRAARIDLGGILVPQAGIAVIAGAEQDVADRGQQHAAADQPGAAATSSRKRDLISGVMVAAARSNRHQQHMAEQSARETRVARTSRMKGSVSMSRQPLSGGMF